MTFAEMKEPGEQFEYISAVLFWRYVKQIKKELDMRKNRKNNSRTRGKRICITAFLLAGSLMLGGCGGKKEKAADSELPEIVIGMDYFEPYSYQTSDGEYKGIDVELAQEAFQRLGYQPKFENIVWEDKDELLADRTIDCLWSSYSMNGREDKYQWAGPYLYSRQMVAVRAESEIKKVQDLKFRDFTGTTAHD